MCFSSLPTAATSLYALQNFPVTSSIISPSGKRCLDFYDVVQLRNFNLFRALRQLQTQNNILNKHLNLTINNCLNNKRKSLLSDYWLINNSCDLESNSSNNRQINLSQQQSSQTRLRNTFSPITRGCIKKNCYFPKFNSVALISVSRPQTQVL